MNVWNWIKSLFVKSAPAEPTITDLIIADIERAEHWYVNGKALLRRPRGADYPYDYRFAAARYSNGGEAFLVDASFGNQDIERFVNKKRLAEFVMRVIERHQAAEREAIEARLRDALKPEPASASEAA